MVNFQTELHITVAYVQFTSLFSSRMPVTPLFVRARPDIGVELAQSSFRALLQLKSLRTHVSIRIAMTASIAVVVLYYTGLCTDKVIFFK